MTGPLLAALLSDVAAGRYPPPDGSVTILPQPSPRDAGVIALTAHSVVFTDIDPAWVRGQLPPGDLLAIRGSPARCGTAMTSGPGKRPAGSSCSAAAWPAGGRSPSR